MSNKKELKRAREKAGYAQAALDAIGRLPRRVGQRVRWRNNVLWERAGDDQWRPYHFDKDDMAYHCDDSVYGFYTSEHVATSAGSFNPLEPAAPGPSRESGDGL